MKPECKVNMEKLTNIVDGMLAEKTELGRQAFNHMISEMTPEEQGFAAKRDNVDYEEPSVVDNFLSDLKDVFKRNGFGEDAKGQMIELFDSHFGDV